MSSVFGGWQKYLTIHYLSIISKMRNFDICVGGGLNSGRDFFEASLLGAKTFMIASEILKNGYTYLGKIISDFEDLMKENDYNSIKELQKFNLKYSLDSEISNVEFDKAVVNINLELCTSCGKCSNNAFCESYINPGVINIENCDGCGFCLSLCHVNAISLVKLDNA
jgi:NAD-dependent dihydropyrimidine dehydrogenase PreA subunit